MANKYAIYTALIGGYDAIQQPLVVDDRFDYVLFTDDARESKIGVWQIRKVDYTNANLIRIARYVKTHPMELLPDYECSVWMDANLQITSSYIYEKAIELYNSEALIASVQHPERDCIYDEIHQMVGQYFESDYMGLKWAHVLWKNHYPFHNGLHETNIVWRRHCDKIQDFNAQWWDYINNYSHRDQFSFDYVLWKNNISCELVLPAGIHSANTEHIRFIVHPDGSQKRKRIKATPKQWRRLKYFYFDGDENTAKRKKYLKKMIRFGCTKWTLELVYWYIRISDNIKYVLKTKQ